MKSGEIPLSVEIMNKHACGHPEAQLPAYRQPEQICAVPFCLLHSGAQQLLSFTAGVHARFSRLAARAEDPDQRHAAWLSIWIMSLTSAQS